MDVPEIPTEVQDLVSVTSFQDSSSSLANEVGWSLLELVIDRNSIFRIGWATLVTEVVEYRQRMKSLWKCRLVSLKSVYLVLRQLNYIIELQHFKFFGLFFVFFFFEFCACNTGTVAIFFKMELVFSCCSICSRWTYEFDLLLVVHFHFSAIIIRLI